MNATQDLYSKNKPVQPGTANDAFIRPGQVWRKKGRKSVRICVWFTSNTPGGRVAANRLDTKRSVAVETTPEGLRGGWICEGLIAKHPAVA